MKALVLSLLIGPLSWQVFAADFNGQLKSTTDFYQQTLGKTTDDLIPYLQVDLNGKHKFTKTFRTQWHIMALSNLESKTSPENFYVDLPEAFVEKKFASWFRLRGGMNTVNWGVVDVSSPSDTINTNALFHPLRNLKRGAPMLQSFVGNESLQLETIYIPVQQRPLLPSEDSRWLPRRFLLNIQSDYGKIIVPDFLEYKYDSPKTLDHALNDNYGAKLSSHQGSVDMQLTHFEGAAPSPKAIPTITLETSGSDIVARSPIRVSPLTYRVRTTGAGLVWAREKWIYRAETAYQDTISSHPLVQPWSWMSVLALETSVDVGSQSVTLLGQYYSTKNPQAADNLISSSYRLFDQTAVLGARYAYSDALTFILTSLYETKTRGVYWSAGFDNKLSDHLKWGASWRDFSASRDGLLKTYDRNDHATMDLIYYF